MSHTYECVIFHKWVSHVSHTNQSRALAQMQTTRHPPTSPPDSYSKSFISHPTFEWLVCRVCTNRVHVRNNTHKHHPKILIEKESCLPFEYIIWTNHVHSATTLTDTTRTFSLWVSHVSHLSESYKQIVRTCATTFTNTTRRFSSKPSHVSF